MSLDKQKILSELGSVVNQLQSADCGCMGKLFSNSNQGQYNPAMGNPLPTCGGCRRSCCHGHGYTQGYSGPCAGEPHPAMNSFQPCMGRCNPPQLYNDTYNYLNQNLMQPTVKEVYDDLKNLTSDNTVVNNPIANQMGLSPQSTMQGNMGMVQNPHMSGNVTNPAMNNMTDGINLNQHSMNHMAQNLQGTMGVAHNPHMSGNTTMFNMPNATNANQQNIGHMGAMGQNIVNMMTGESKAKPNSMPQNRQLTDSMIIDAPQSPHGQVGVIPVQAANEGNVNHYGINSGMTYSNPGILAQNPITQHTSHASDANSNIQGSHMMSNIAQNNVLDSQQTRKVNPTAQQMASNPHGQHTPGIKKFNEMFPGVMQGLGGDLGFDPMAIAIQMNPANQQRAAIESMQKMMSSNRMNKIPDTPFVNNANGINENATNLQAPNQVQQNVILSNQTPNQQNVKSMNQAQPTATGSPITSQPQRMPPNDQNQYQGSNTGAVLATSLPTHLNTQMQPPSQTMPQSSTPTKELILPVDSSKNNQQFIDQQKYFNTLGQPVQVLPASLYQSPEPKLPQTLSPLPAQSGFNNDAKYSNVKSTVSKTSLVGNRVGKTASKSQLQRIYNQYKGSHSYTQQNITSDQKANQGSLSVGRLNVPPAIAQQQHIPVESVAGDTIANTRAIIDQPPNKMEFMEQIGDAPVANKLQTNETLDKVSPLQKSKCRNGLQDMVYTSYPTSAAWSFHGQRSAALSNRYRFQNKPR